MNHYECVTWSLTQSYQNPHHFLPLGLDSLLKTDKIDILLMTRMRRRRDHSG